MDNWIKCPFQIDEHGKMHDCHMRSCMAFRRNDEVFWCAKLKSPQDDMRSFHPVEMIDEDINW